MLQPKYNVLLFLNQVVTMVMLRKLIDTGESRGNN